MDSFTVGSWFVSRHFAQLSLSKNSGEDCFMKWHIKCAKCVPVQSFIFPFKKWLEYLWCTGKSLGSKNKNTIKQIWPRKPSIGRGWGRMGSKKFITNSSCFSSQLYCPGLAETLCWLRASMMIDPRSWFLFCCSVLSTLYLSHNMHIEMLFSLVWGRLVQSTVHP